MGAETVGRGRGGCISMSEGAVVAEEQQRVERKEPILVSDDYLRREKGSERMRASAMVCNCD